RLGNGLARVPSKVEEEGKKPDRLPDGRRIDLIAAHEGRPQQVSPLWKVGGNTTDRFDSMSATEIVRTVLLWRVPTPLEAADQPLDAATERSGLVYAPEHLGEILQNLPSRPHGLEVQALHALISLSVRVKIVPIMKTALADQAASHLRVGQRRKQPHH